MSFKIGFQHQLGAFAANVAIHLSVKVLSKIAKKLEGSRDVSPSDESTVEERIEENPLNNTISRETLERISDIFMDLDDNNKEEEK